MLEGGEEADAAAGDAEHITIGPVHASTARCETKSVSPAIASLSLVGAAPLAFAEALRAWLPNPCSCSGRLAEADGARGLVSEAGATDHRCVCELSRLVASWTP